MSSRASAACLAVLVALLAAPAADAADASFEAVSADGSRIWFTTAEPLVVTDTDAATDVYERSAGTTRLVSGGAGNVAARFEGISSDGDDAFFSTTEPLSSIDSDGERDVYARVSSGVLRIATDTGLGADAESGATFRESALDGRYVFFSTSEALTTNDIDNGTDIYRYDLSTTEVILFSRRPSGDPLSTSNLSANFRDASDSGGRVFFTTSEPVSGDSDAEIDLYAAGTTGSQRVSLGPDGGQGAFDVTFCTSTADGSAVVFRTAEKLVTGTANIARNDGDDAFDIYVRDLAGSATWGATLARDGDFAASCAGGASGVNATNNGLGVSFTTTEDFTDASSTDTDGEDRDLIETQLDLDDGTLIVPLGGAPFYYASLPDDEMDATFRARASGELIYTSPGADTGDASADGGCDGPGGNCIDVFSANRSAGRTLRSTGPGLLGASNDAAYTDASANGRVVMFTTRARLVNGDDDDFTDVFVHDVDATPKTIHASIGAVNGDQELDADGGGVNAAGTHFIYESSETLSNRDGDIDELDVYQLTGSTTSLISGEAIPPETTIDSGPSTETDRTPTFNFSSSEIPSTFECRLENDANFGPCSGIGTHTTQELGNNDYVFYVRAVDRAGNADPTPASMEFTIDFDPPETTITSPPHPPSTDSTPTFRFEASKPNSTFVCQIAVPQVGFIGEPCPEAATSGGVTRGSVTVERLAPGTYSLFVQGRSSNGSVDASPAAQEFTVLPDSRAPQTRITGGRRSFQLQEGERRKRVRVRFVSSEPSSTFLCKVGRTPFRSCRSPLRKRLAEGKHKIKVIAIDLAGNRDASPARRRIRVKAAG